MGWSRSPRRPCPGWSGGWPSSSRSPSPGSSLEHSDHSPRPNNTPFIINIRNHLLQGLHPCTQTILRDLNTTFIINIPDPLPRVFTWALKSHSETKTHPYLNIFPIPFLMVFTSNSNHSQRPNHTLYYVYIIYARSPTQGFHLGTQTILRNLITPYIMCIYARSPTPGSLHRHSTRSPKNKLS